MEILFNIWFIAIGLFSLGFCIFIHEFGHFIAAKKRGLVADRFSIGFGPRLFGWHRNGTDFRVSLLPLGGYVSLPQLADMGRLEGAEEKEADKLPPISYADKMIVAVMGAVFNLIFAFVLSLLLWGFGREVIASTEINVVEQKIETSEGEEVPSPAYQAGLRQGDTVLRVDGRPINSWMDLQSAIATGTGRTEDGRPQVRITVRRDGAEKTFTVHPVLTTSEELRAIGVRPARAEGAAPVIGRVQKDMPAHEAGLQSGDRILALDGEPVRSSAFLRKYLENHGDRPIEITLERDGSELVIPVQPRIAEGESRPRFGFSYGYPPKTKRVHRNPVEQLSGFADTLWQTLYALLHQDSDVKVRNMSGPVGIVHGLTAMARYGVMDLVWFLALINVNLAIINLLPIPVLDGGHMLFATISKIVGRPLPRRFMEGLQGAFVVLLLSFMLYVTFFDVGRIGRVLDWGGGEDPAEATENEPSRERKGDAPDNDTAP